MFQDVHEGSAVTSHHRFFGFAIGALLQSLLATEMAATKSKQEKLQQVLYTILPYVSKAMRSSSHELINAGLVAICQLSCGGASRLQGTSGSRGFLLTSNYAKAFLKQLIMTLRQLSKTIGSQAVE